MHHSVAAQNPTSIIICPVLNEATLLCGDHKPGHFIRIRIPSESSAVCKTGSDGYCTRTLVAIPAVAAKQSDVSSITQRRIYVREPLPSQSCSFDVSSTTSRIPNRETSLSGERSSAIQRYNHLRHTAKPFRGYPTEHESLNLSRMAPPTGKPVCAITPRIDRGQNLTILPEHRPKPTPPPRIQRLAP